MDIQLKQQFLEKAEKYFDAKVTDHQALADSIAVDMSILLKRERALWLARRQPKQVDLKPKEAQTQPLIAPDTIYCRKHKGSNWGINPKTGTYYSQCKVGFEKAEPCQLGTD